MGCIGWIPAPSMFPGTLPRGKAGISYMYGENKQIVQETTSTLQYQADPNRHTVRGVMGVGQFTALLGTASGLQNAMLGKIT